MTKKVRIPLEPLLTNKQAAAKLGFHPEAFAKMRRAGRGPEYIKWGAKESGVRYTDTLLADWMNANVVDPKAA